MKASYPDKLESRILALEAPGGLPARISAVVPTVLAPGETFAIRIAVMDDRGCPSLEADGAVSLGMPDGSLREILVRQGSPAVGALTGLQIAEEGLYRLEANFKNLHAYANPLLCMLRPIPRVFWGDPHVHTVISNCHSERCRSLDFAYVAARHLTGLDWLAVADHVSNGRSSAGSWKAQRLAAERFDDPPYFTTLPAYEASLKGGAGGDNNIYMRRFSGSYADDYDDGNVRTLCAKLRDLLPPGDFFAVPHHTTRTGKHGELPGSILPDSAAMPVVEIHSKWGASEYRGNPNPLQEIHEGPSYVVDFLRRGMRLGFIGGTDTHATMPFGPGDEPEHIDRLPGGTAVQCGSLTREDVFDALRNRQCYAVSGERILLHGTIRGMNFGEEGVCDDESPVRIEVLAAACSDIERVDVVRNGETLHSCYPEGWQVRLEFDDVERNRWLSPAGEFNSGFAFYYIRVVCANGTQAWSSPVWLTRGVSE